LEKIMTKIIPVKKLSNRSFFSQTFTKSKDPAMMEVLGHILSHPMAKYLAMGVGAALLLRWANNLNEKFPELSSFIKENLNLVEKRLNSLRRQIQE